MIRLAENVLEIPENSEKILFLCFVEKRKNNIQGLYFRWGHIIIIYCEISDYCWISLKKELFAAKQN